MGRLAPLVFLSLAAALAHVALADVRGVAQSQQAAYAGDVFTCKDGSVSFPSSQVNDDYCDCPDGSDEPGTSACANGEFYCTNKGYRGEVIHAAHVNDGICDCCDGTDEYLSGACKDTCDEVGAAYRAARAEEIKRIEAGSRIKAEYIAQGQAALAASSASLAEATEAVAAAIAAKDEAEAAFKEAEAKDKEQGELAGDSTRAARLTALGIADMSVEQLQDLVLQLAEQADAADTLVTILKEPLDGEAQSAIHWVAPESAVDTESPETVAAREAFNAANRAVSDAEARERNLQKDANTDYGTEFEYYALKGQCFSVKVQQYEYKVCPFDNAKQDYTSLGTFDKWEEEDGNKVMAFTNGQHCWNGPNRSMRVTVVCGDANILEKVDEPSMCAYTSTLRTPAACPSPKAHVNLEPHKEL